MGRYKLPPRFTKIASINKENKHMSNIFMCPIQDVTCVYCEKDGVCSLGFPAYQICEDAKEEQEKT